MNESKQLSIISTRESEVLHLIAYELTTSEIAQKLYISSSTVDTHRRNMMEKLSAKNAAGLIRRAFEAGILGQSLN